MLLKRPNSVSKAKKLAKRADAALFRGQVARNFWAVILSQAAWREAVWDIILPKANKRGEDLFLTGIAVWAQQLTA